MDQMGYRRFAITGCVQSGKTLTAVVIPLLWHLFHRRETCIYGIPSMDLAGDKWREEIVPVIEASPDLRKYIPKRGQGSKGGTPSTINFRNGTTLKFMSAHGRDDKRSAFTAPVVLKTEVDRYDEAGTASREADPARQMDARTESFGSEAWIYEECTTTTELGRINVQFHRGTQTELYVPCPKCRDFFLPGRESLVDWKEGGNDIEASRNARFLCPHCEHKIDDAERMESLNEMVPLSAGQQLQDGEIVGDEPLTDILSMRWNAYHNKFWSIPHIAKAEYTADHAVHFESEEKARRQFAWALPAAPEEFDVTPLSIDQILRLSTKTGRGMVPEGYDKISVGCDLRKRQLHYVVGAWNERGQCQIIEASIIPVDSDRVGVQPALLQALRTLREMCEAGFAGKQCGWVWIDAGYKPEVVRAFCKESLAMKINRYLASFGRGASQQGRDPKSYNHPSKKTGDIRLVGDEYHVRYHQKHLTHAAFVNSDSWKTFLHEGLSAPEAAPGAIRLFDPVTEEDHKTLRTWARQVTTERATTVVKPGKGPVVVWVRDGVKTNHFLDASYLMCAAAHLTGVRIVADPVAVKPAAQAVRKQETITPSIFDRKDSKYV